MSFCAFAQLVTTFFFFQLEKSRVKLPKFNKENEDLNRDIRNQMVQSVSVNHITFSSNASTEIKFQYTFCSEKTYKIRIWTYLQDSIYTTFLAC
jgi:hypothetical protein